MPWRGSDQSSTSASASISRSASGFMSTTSWKECDVLGRRLTSGVMGHGTARLGLEVDGRSGVVRREMLGRCKVGVASGVAVRVGRRAGWISEGRRVGCVVSSWRVGVDIRGRREDWEGFLVDVRGEVERGMGEAVVERGDGSLILERDEAERGDESSVAFERDGAERGESSCVDEANRGDGDRSVSFAWDVSVGRGGSGRSVKAGVTARAILFFAASHSGKGASGSLVSIARGTSGCESPRPGRAGLIGFAGSLRGTSVLLSTKSSELAEMVISWERALNTDSCR